MKIVHLAAGAGSMYCGACAHDVHLTRGLRERGHDAVVVPLYTPLKVDGDVNFPVTDIYLGGINAYFQQHFGLSRVTPRWMDALWDRPGLLRWASRFAIRTNPSQLGPMTVSVLKGTDGKQRKEFNRLCLALAKLNPDVISITNSLLSGVAPVLKAKLKKPIVCFLQGEDGFLNSLGAPYTEQAITAIRRNATFIDRFIAPCEDHASCMKSLLGLTSDQIEVIRMGIDASLHEARSGAPPTRPFTIGYLSVITPQKGLDLLLKAAHSLDIRVKIAGKVLDKDFAKELHTDSPMRGELTTKEKIDFLHSIDLFCLPTRLREARGVVALEAMAAGVPCLVPSAGVFPEMIELTSGGALFTQGSVDSLKASIDRLAKDRNLLAELASRAPEGVKQHYSAKAMAEKTATIYQSLIPTNL